MGVQIIIYRKTNKCNSNETTHQTIPWAPDPIGFKFWYRFRMVNLVSPTSTV